LGRRGFTLLELVLVIGILVIIAGTVVATLDSASEDAALQLARSELGTLRDGCIRWRADMGAYPDASAISGSATVSPLIALTLQSGQSFQDGAGIPYMISPTLNPWNPATRRGWRGPYVSFASSRIITIKVNGATGDPDSGGALWSVIAEPRDVLPPAGAPASDATDGSKRAYYWFSTAVDSSGVSHFTIVTKGSASTTASVNYP
jgi:prepilin-type N-terminal cleavage/methylation domain-containing protein